MLFVAGTSVRAAEQSGPPIYGSLSAQHTLVVWGSFTCPYTIRLMQVLIKIVQDSNGTVNIQWRHLPAHDHDPILHAVSLSDPNKFWNFAFGVMTKFMTGSDPSKWTWEQIVEMGKTAGIPEEALARARDDKANWEVLQQDYLAAKLLRVEKTPGLFYNGYFMTPDGMPFDVVTFDKSLRAMLEGKAAQK